MQVIEVDVTTRQLHLHILHVQGIIGDMDIGGQALQREAALLVKGETLNPDVEIVILKARQGQVSSQIVHCQMVGIKLAHLARLVEHVIGER